MELKKGFKQTEIGYIPEDWNVAEIGSIGEVKMCRRVFNEQTRPAGDIPFYKIGTFGKEPDAFISKDLYISYRQKFSFPKKGDILISAAGTIGRTIVYNGEPAYFQDSNIVWVDNNGLLVSNDLLYHIFKIVKYNTEGGTIQRLYNSILKSTKFPLSPNKIEQQVIANALSDADVYIESLEKLIAKNRLIKKGVIQELLSGKRRLPGYKQSWRYISLGEISDPRKQWSFTGGPFGSNLKSSDYTADGVRVIQLQNIGDGEFVDDYEIFTSKKKADELISCNIYPGEIILSKMGDPVARACIIPSTHDRYLMCSDGIRLAVNQEKFDTDFICEQINNIEFRQKADNAGTGSTRKRIGLTELRNLTLYVPDFNEQKSISEILKDINSDIKTKEIQLQKARLIKQGMMQELLTGRIRLV